MKRIVMALFAAVVISHPAFAGEQDGALPTVKPGAIIYSMDNGWAPFQFKDEKENPAGFDVDLAGEIGKHLGVVTEFFCEEWTKAQNQVRYGKADFLLSCSPSAERDVVFDRKDYSYDVVGFYTLETNPYKTIEDLFGKRVGIEKGVLVDVYNKYKSKIRSSAVYEGMDNLLDALVKQETVAVATEKIPLFYLAHKKQVKLKIILEEKSPIGVIVKKGNALLADKLNEAILKIQQDGTWERLNEKWFGVADALPKFKDK